MIRILREYDGKKGEWKMEIVSKEIFGLLNDLRQFPNYQLERRLDIYFTYYLPKILMECLGNKNNDINVDLSFGNKHKYKNLIPEFPLLVGIKGKSGSDEPKEYKSWFLNGLSNYEKFEITRHSEKVDYVFIDKNNAYFIELKTSLNSIGSKQAESLSGLYKKGRSIWRDLITDALFISWGHKEYERLESWLCNSPKCKEYGVEIVNKDKVMSLLDSKYKRLKSNGKFKAWRDLLKHCEINDLIENRIVVPIYIIPTKKKTFFDNEDNKVDEKYENIKVITFEDIFEVVIIECAHCIEKERTLKSFAKKRNERVECFCELLENIYIRELNSKDSLFDE